MVRHEQPELFTSARELALKLSILPFSTCSDTYTVERGAGKSGVSLNPKRSEALRSWRQRFAHNVRTNPVGISIGSHGLQIDIILALLDTACNGGTMAPCVSNHFHPSPAPTTPELLPPIAGAFLEGDS